MEIENYAEILKNKEKRNWIEDFAHENGNYINTCFFCDHQFLGHKRRNLCKKYANPTKSTIK